MTISLIAGGGIGFALNAHRHGWSGRICQQPTAWNCGVKIEFRETKCEQGIPSCFHISAFDKHSPSVVVHDNGIGWLFGDDPDLLVDQVLLLWGPPAYEPRGKSSQFSPNVVYGAYRIKSVSKEEGSWSTKWRIRPYQDGWTRFGSSKVQWPRYTNLNGQYVKGVERSQLLRCFDEVAESARTQPNSWIEDGDKERFRVFHANLQKWVDIAGQKINQIKALEPSLPAAPEAVYSTGTATNRPLSNIRLTTATPATTPPRASIESILPTKGRRSCVEPAQLTWIRENYGTQVEQMLQVAGLTKPMIVFRGHPGVGKSYLAMRMLDDPKRERTLSVPVGSTWRGREDLLGYVNPISGEFEATPFTKFLIKSEQVWRTGDRAPRNIVFEEFNLSQPEHWLSDILAVSQYENEVDRFVELGGKQLQRVFLSPAVSFLATINSDHTTRPLSPRVLDRCALIDLRAQTKDVLDRFKIQLAEEEFEAVDALDFHLRARGACFSLRSARSLKSCLDNLAQLGIDRWRAIDLVLVQEVLSKVRLMAHDPSDGDLINALKKWSDEYGSKLSQSSLIISEWEEELALGHDIAQA